MCRTRFLRQIQHIVYAHFNPKDTISRPAKYLCTTNGGNIVWYSDEVENGIFVGKWDGRCNGEMMASDVYIWKMEATFLDGQTWEGFNDINGKKSKFGSVTLIR